MRACLHTYMRMTQLWECAYSVTLTVDRRGERDSVVGLRCFEAWRYRLWDAQAQWFKLDGSDDTEPTERQFVPRVCAVDQTPYCAV